MDFLPKNIESEVKIAPGLTGEALELLSELGFSGKKVVLVSDERIFRACEGYFSAEFYDFLTGKVILDEPRPDEAALAAIAEEIKGCDLILGLGSGVISDLCKYSAAESALPYVIFASAPSMNGYLSQNASLIVNEHRKSVAATLPLAVFCDLEILRQAPKNMIKAGIGDSMCFYTCWFDWILSHILLGTEFNPECFAILHERMANFVQNYQDFAIDDEFLRLLMEILLLSGASMSLAGSSAPASQSEHLIAHAFSMKYPRNGVLHGLQIATTCLTSAKIQEEFLALDELQMRDFNFPKAKMVDLFGEVVARECERDFAKKAALISSNQRVLAMDLGQNWGDYAASLAKILLPEAGLRDIFGHFGIEVGPGALGIGSEEYYELVGVARFVRGRFTVLDL